MTKATLTILFILCARFLFAQSDSARPTKHDTTVIVINNIIDTLKADLIWYKGNSSLKNQEGFIVRQYKIQIDDKGRKSQPYDLIETPYDDKWKRFTKKIDHPNPRQ